MAKGHFTNGTVEGTGASIDVSCGFTPSYVRIINIDGDAIMEWTDDMTSGEAYKTVGAGTGAQIATLGVTPYVGVAGGETSPASVGFTIGADTDVNAAAETIMWVAFGKE